MLARFTLALVIHQMRHIVNFKYPVALRAQSFEVLRLGRQHQSMSFVLNVPANEGKVAELLLSPESNL